MAKKKTVKDEIHIDKKSKTLNGKPNRRRVEREAADNRPPSKKKK